MKESLAEDGDATVVIYEIRADVSGNLVQLGGQLIEGTSKKLTDHFRQARGIGQRAVRRRRERCTNTDTDHTAKSSGMRG